MPSPFPGMDPYLEGYLWPDVHHRLATQISDQLMPLLRPRYVARIEIQVVPDETPEADIGIMYPDVEIVRARQSESALLPASAAAGTLSAASQSITPATLSVPLLDIEVRLATVEIRDTASNRLVSSIEILSPVKREAAALHVTEAYHLFTILGVPAYVQRTVQYATRCQLVCAAAAPLADGA